jgi:hypothetical protein
MNFLSGAGNTGRKVIKAGLNKVPAGSRNIGTNALKAAVKQNFIAAEQARLNPAFKANFSHLLRPAICEMGASIRPNPSTGSYPGLKQVPDWFVDAGLSTKQLNSIMSYDPSELPTDNLPSAVHVKIIEQRGTESNPPKEFRPFNLIFGGGGITEALIKSMDDDGQASMNITRTGEGNQADEHLTGNLSRGELTDDQKEFLAQNIADNIFISGANHLSVFNNVGPYKNNEQIAGPGGEKLKQLVEDANLGYHENAMEIIGRAQEILEENTPFTVSVVTLGTTYRSTDKNNPCQVFSEQKEACVKDAASRGYTAIGINTGLIATAQFESSPGNTPEAAKNCQTETEVAQSCRAATTLALEENYSTFVADTFKMQPTTTLSKFAERILDNRNTETKLEQNLKNGISGLTLPPTPPKN